MKLRHHATVRVHEPSQVKSYCPKVHKARKPQSASPLRGLIVGASEQGQCSSSKQETPRGMSGSGSADKALGAIPAGHPPPDWQCRLFHYLPAGLRVVRGGRNPPHRGRLTATEVDPRRSLSAQSEAVATELYPPSQPCAA